MKGTRKFIGEEGFLDLAEGEYGKCRDGVWYARPPGFMMGCLGNHDVTEHEDGTITVSPSILFEKRNENFPGWHGYLEKGVWREC